MRGRPSPDPGDPGFTLLEALLVLAILATLGVVGLTRLDLGNPGLNVVQGELRASLEQAFLLARARGCDIHVALQCAERSGILPLHLPRGVRWGLPPAGIPFPAGMDPPVRAHRCGQSHPWIIVTPRGTATASVWFLTDGRDAVCLRLAGRGRIHLLRWRHRQRLWTDEGQACASAT